MKRFLLLTVLLAALAAHAADTDVSADPWSELEQMRELDQQDRQRLHDMLVKGQTKSAEFQTLSDRQTAVDAANIARLAELLDRHGWPRGGRASNTAFLVIQHAEPAVQRRYFPMMREAQQRGDLSATELGMLEDRMRVRDGKPQRYGSQLSMGPGNKLRFDPIEDEANVDKRRAAIGMEPIAAYAKHFGLAYTPPAIKLPRGRCPTMPAPEVPSLKNGDFNLVARFLLKADGRVENLRVTGQAPKSLTRAVENAIGGYRCQPAETDQEIVSEFRINVS